MIHPKDRTDLLLAPVAAEVNQNLEQFRELSPTAIEGELQLQLDSPLIQNTREERAQRILRVALRNVEMHGWTGQINHDASALHLDGGSVSLDLALSPTLRKYVEQGPSA